jgi:hypothetical protein
MSMLENLKKAEAEHGLGGGEYFKVQNGNNVIRVLCEGVPHEGAPAPNVPGGTEAERMSNAVRKIPVALQDRVNELDRGLKLPARTLRLLTRFRQRAADRFAHHPPVHPQFLRHPYHRPDPKLVLATDLFE